MVKTLTRHGNSFALIIDKTLMELMRIDENTPLSITVNGRTLLMAPVSDPKRQAKFERAKRDTFKKYDKALRRLAE